MHKNKIIIKSCFLLSLLFINFAVADQINHPIVVNGIKQGKNYLVFDEKYQKLLHTISKDTKDSNEFFHILNFADSGSGKLALSDLSEWDIGWWYKSDLETWKKGDRLKITYHLDKMGANTVEFYNVDRKITAWGSFISWPPESKMLQIVDIPNEGEESNGYNHIHLSNDWVCQGPGYITGAFKVWNIKDQIYIFHDKDKYAIYNRTKKVFQFGCSISKKTPESNIQPFDSHLILKLESKLNQRVLAQPEATKAITTSLLNYTAGLNDPNTPVGVFLFIGPTGVGKTELAKVLAEELYKSPEALIRFDMSQFNTKWAITRLIGASPGYVNHEEGGQLTEALKKHPQSIVLLDEMEKADDEIRKFFLSVFDEGYIRDAKNTLIDCKNVIFIMTSNISSHKIVNYFDKGFESDEIMERIEPDIMKELSPELYNRIQPVLFCPLTEEVMENLVDLLLDKLTQRLKETKNIMLQVDRSVHEYLIQNGFHPTLGARPLKKLIEKKVTSALALVLIGENVPSGSKMRISYDLAEDEWSIDWEV